MSKEYVKVDEAIKKDSQWKAVVPITSTHFLTSNKGKIVIPNNTGSANEINMLDMFNPSILNDRSLLLQMENKQYPRRRGAPPTLLELEGFFGDSEYVIQFVEKTIKDRAKSHSTVLTSHRELRKGRK